MNVKWYYLRYYRENNSSYMIERSGIESISVGIVPLKSFKLRSLKKENLSRREHDSEKMNDCDNENNGLNNNKNQK